MKAPEPASSTAAAGPESSGPGPSEPSEASYSATEQDQIARARLQNAVDLEGELAWLGKIIETRFALYFEGQTEPLPDVSTIFDIPPPDLGSSDSSYAGFVRHYELGFAERLAIILALAPRLRPQVLDIFFTINKRFDRRFTEFGGVSWREGYFLPTVETLLFLLAGRDLHIRLAIEDLFDPHHFFSRHGIFALEEVDTDGPQMAKRLRLADSCLDLLVHGRPRRPEFGPSFPARYVETSLSWADLVLHPSTRKQLEEIEIWMRHGERLLDDWRMAGKLRPGYRSLFYGPPGTGKTLTACLLGKATGRDVYRIDLSMVVSKYIGETEKNLSRVFERAQHRNWILFFDEADALFGQRTESRNSHDRHANQEVSFLLQRIETFDGLAILASNLRQNMDRAFFRRFESVVHFPAPGPKERLLLWRKGFPAEAELEATLDLEALARDHALTGADIMNVIRYASLRTLANGTSLIRSEDVMTGIRREYAKEGKVA